MASRETIGPNVDQPLFDPVSVIQDRLDYMAGIAPDSDVALARLHTDFASQDAGERVSLAIKTDIPREDGGEGLREIPLGQATFDGCESGDGGLRAKFTLLPSGLRQETIETTLDPKAVIVRPAKDQSI